MRRLIGLSMLIVAVAGCGGADGGAAAAGVVPWAGRPAPPFVFREPRPLPYPTSAPACGAGALAIGRTPTGAATGHLLDRLVFRNTGRTACLLRGLPTITGVDARGRRVRLHLHRMPRGTFFGPLVPADMPPGGHVYLDLASEDVTCTPGRPTVYRDLWFGLPGGGAVRSGLSLARTPGCPGHDLSPFGLPPRTSATVAPRPGSPDTLRVAVSAPRSTRRGAVLRYVVTLTNPTRTAVRLAPCPGYTEALDAVYLAGGRDRKADRRAAFFLNCDGVHAIAPGHRVRYAMRFALGRFPAASAKLSWHLDTPGEPGSAAAITVR